MILDLNLAKAKSGLDIPITLKYEIPKEIFEEYGFDADSVCELNLSYSYNVDYVLVNGFGSVCLTGNCYRCGEKTNQVLKFEFEEKFLPANSIENSDSIETYVFVGDKIDITKMVEDNLLTALPHQFLCKEDCKGLCPQCFANLNTQTCACKPLIHNAFACLNDLKID